MPADIGVVKQGAMQANMPFPSWVLGKTKGFGVLSGYPGREMHRRRVAFLAGETTTVNEQPIRFQRNGVPMHVLAIPKLPIEEEFKGGL